MGEALASRGLDPRPGELEKLATSVFHSVNRDLVQVLGVERIRADMAEGLSRPLPAEVEVRLNDCLIALPVPLPGSRPEWLAARALYVLRRAG